MSDPLEVLLADGVIDEVLGRLKSGKEANISLVRRGDDVYAAKVYKDRTTRSFKNNADYKEGRKVRNSRTQRAMDSGGRFGRDAAEEAWKSAEADALYRLVDSGVRVPRPVMFYEGVLVMELVRDAEGRPAPRLIDVAIDRNAALRIYADLVAQMIAMLCCDVIHGDLSPYNILASDDGPTIIDFPQTISAVHNSRAEYFFLRDFDNVVRFIAGFDPSLAPHVADGRAIWRAYVSRDLTPQYVPPPPPPPRPTRGPDRRSQHPRGPNGPGPGGPRGSGGPPPRGPNAPSQPPRGSPSQPSRGAQQPRGPQQPSPPRGPERSSTPPQPRAPQAQRWQTSPPSSSSPPPQQQRWQTSPPSPPSPPSPSSPSSSSPPSWQAQPPRSSARPPAAGPRPAAGPSPGKRGGRRRPKRHW
ncbi:MAG: hypothetical protein NT062_06455 [Proteobacteria bacterium]|nr:hypothetical protein [Pseudomonadota bacterium]